jgi:hypothetical protein
MPTRRAIKDAWDWGAVDFQLLVRMGRSQVAHVCVLGLLATASCSSRAKVANAPAPDGSVQFELPTAVSGVVQKGPYVLGSSITVQELDSSLAPTGRTFEVVTINSEGAFSVPIHVSSQYVEVIASGYYFDELTNQLSAGPLTLRALADLSVGATIDVNLLTSMSEPLARKLMAQGETFASAEAHASQTLIAALGFPALTQSFSNVSFTGAGAASGELLAASLVVEQYARSLGNAEVAQLTLLLSEIGAAAADAGTGNPALEALTMAICPTAASIDVSAVRANLAAYYAGLGASVAIADFESFIALARAGCVADASTGDSAQTDAASGSSCAGGWMGFANRVDYATATDPQALAIGDLNLDHHPDLAVSTIFGGLSVLMNTGNGTFSTHTDYGQGKGTSVAIGDVNGDGVPDVAVVNSGGMATLGGSDSVGVFLNQGSGTLAAPQTYATGSAPRSVAIGDLNRDGKPDLAVSNYSGNSVSVLLNSGGGVFGAASDSPAGFAPWSLTEGDVNGDGNPDLVVPNYLGTDGGGPAVTVLINQGGGTFAPPATYSPGAQPVSIAIGDLNADGKPDLAVVNNGSNTVSVLLNRGNGTFGASADYGVGSNPTSVAIGDLNGDGSPDLAVSNGNYAGTGPSTVSVLLNGGRGTFPIRNDYGVGGGPASLAIADLDHDGRLDLAVANYGSASVSILINLGCR